MEMIILHGMEVVLRDYIHVCDIAHAHTLAIKYLEKEKTESAVKYLTWVQVMALRFWKQSMHLKK